MKKIPTLFVRDEDARQYVTREVTPGCEWVLAGEGVATIKHDGMCCKIDSGQRENMLGFYKRFEARPLDKAVPPNFVPADDLDPVTRKQPGWLPVGDGPEDQYFREAFQFCVKHDKLVDGTYELMGPKVQKNSLGLAYHILMRHGMYLPDVQPIPAYDHIRTFLANRPGLEGLVYHHADGRMAKIKRRDFRSES
jgi:hypothetical protein